MRIARDLAGFTMGEADLLRKAMGKKDPKVMAKMRERFENGAVERGLQAKKATKIFDLMEYFAGYGFNKSHSTTYALLAYQTAYLKANYPQHFMAALLTIESQNTEKLAVLPGGVPRHGRHGAARRTSTSASCSSRWKCCWPRRAGRPLRPGRDQERRRRRDPVDAGVAQGQRRDPRPRGVLRARRPAPRQQARASRAWSRPARSIRSTRPTPPGRRSRRTSRRARLYAAIDRALEQGGRRQVDREQGQSRLFGGDAGDADDDRCRRWPPAPPWSEEEMLRGEKEALGLYLSGHPLERHAEGLKAAGAHTSATLADGPGRRRRHHGRHRRGLPHRQDAQGRPHGRLHARGPDRQRRGRGLPRAVQAVRLVHRERPHGGGDRPRRSRRRSAPRCAPPRSRTSRR